MKDTRKCIDEALAAAALIALMIGAPLLPWIARAAS
jgi:hypothetical protein